MQTISDRQTAARLAVLFGAIFVPIGFYMPFFPLWLAARGLDTTQIGLVLALPPLIRIWSAPLVSRQADRRGDLAGALLICSALVAVGLAATGFAGSATVIALCVMATALVWGPVIALLDSLALAAIARRPAVDYGRVRLWGSVTFMAATLAGGWFTERVPAVHLIWLIAGTAALAALAAGWAVAWSRVERLETRGRPADPVPTVRLSGICVAMIVAGASLIQASHAFLYAFGTLTWKAAGYDGDFIGLAWAVGVLAEIVLFAVVGRILKGVGAAFVLLAIGGLVATARWSLLATGPEAAALLMLQVLHAFSFAATHVGAVFLLGHAAGRTGRASLQGWYAGASAAGMSLCSWISGQLSARFAGEGFFGMSVVAILGLILVLAAMHSLFRRQKTLAGVAG